MNIRDAQVDDVLVIRNLVSSLSYFYLESSVQPLPEWFLNTLAHAEFERRILSDKFNNYVCCDNDEIVGYISLKDRNHLYHLFVSEKYQGKGIAKALWNHILVTSQADSYIVRSSMYAVPVYKRFGFIESGRVMSKEGISFQPMVLTMNQQ